MKERLDTLLVKQGYYPSREKAKRAIMAGLVYVNKGISDKAGTMIDVDAEIWVKQDQCPFVGRGGLKLAKAVEVFGLELAGAAAMDIGASTGGFTDCMLQNGAEKVYAVDVGYGQLDWKLRNDPRVVNMEKVNIRYLDPELIAEPLDFISVDVSFISLALVLPVAKKLLAPEGQMVCLVKPQFEAGREQVGKHGVVKEPAVHRQVLEKAAGYADRCGLRPAGFSFSPMTGAKGNIEYLMLLKNTVSDSTEESDDAVKEERSQLIGQVVVEAHQTLG